MDEPTVLVIGGGATGAGVARDLALRGVNVTLVDRDGLASGTSGRSHGVLHSGARYAESDPRDAEDCIAENQILRDVAGACIDDTGGLFVELAGDDPDYFAAKREACAEAGIPTSVVDSHAARSAVPGLSDDVRRAIRVPDAVVSPSRLVAANAADARANGGVVHTHAPVQGIHVDGGRITGVEVGGTVDRRLEPGYVVNAAGPWAGAVADMAGVEVGMAPTRGVMVAVEYEGLDPVLNRCRKPADGDIVVPRAGEAILGTTSVPVEDPDAHETPDWEVEETVQECAAMLPGVADVPRLRTWWGVRPLYAPDEADEARGISRGFATLDHADDGVDNFISVVGGKLTTYRLMAETAADLVCDRLGVDADCVTAEHKLPAADDPDQLDALVAEFDGRNPTDAEVVTDGGE